jgi:predicted ArsR family transcriptional regulator
VPLDDELGSRQQQIIGLLLREGPLTMADLADQLGMGKTSLRPQVDRLVLQGWLDRAQRRQGPGRPADVFSVSDRSRERFAHPTMDEFARLLLEEITAREAKPKVKSIMDGVGQRLVEVLRPVVGEGPPAERARRLAAYLTERGILSESGDSRKDVTLTIHACPYAGAAGAHRELCAMHARAVGALLGGKAHTHQWRHDGEPCCEFRVALKPGKSSSDAGGRSRTRRAKSKVGKRRA